MQLSGTVFSSFIKLTLDQVGLDKKSFEDFTLCLQVSYKNEVLNYTVMLLERPSNRMYVTGQKICNCNCKTQIIFGIYHYLYDMYVQIIICYNMAMVCQGPVLAHLRQYWPEGSNITIDGLVSFKL